MDNSSGGQVWVQSERQPFSGDLLHLSYGKSSLFKVVKESIDGGGREVVRFPLRFESGIMRGRFNVRDGQLYLVGPRVRQSNGARYGAFQRVRYTGQPVHMPLRLNVMKDAISITFTNALDPASAVDEQIGQLTGGITNDSNYGSKMYSTKDPSKVVCDKRQGAFGGDSLPVMKYSFPMTERLSG